MNTLAHPVEGTAAADIGDSGIDIVIAWIGVGLHESGCCHDDSRVYQPI